MRAGAAGAAVRVLRVVRCGVRVMGPGAGARMASLLPVVFGPGAGHLSATDERAAGSRPPAGVGPRGGDGRSGPAPGAGSTTGRGADPGSSDGPTRGPRGTVSPDRPSASVQIGIRGRPAAEDEGARG